MKSLMSGLKLRARLDETVDYNSETVDIYVYLDTMRHSGKLAEIIKMDAEHIKNLTEKVIELQRLINGYKNTLVLLRANAHTQN